ncbi:hypothetical protein ACQ86N_19860 [Puia sp. P3]|uniref:hypothetical protein n=1 Tax=Puia sp. P3 TaxID=3423952 RepID=UPI003D66443E
MIIGQYMTSPTTGLIASGQGTIYSISGTSFDATSEFTLDYQSKWKINYLQWQSLSAVDGNNLLITGVGNDSTVYPVAQRPLVAVKTNGTYEEYLLPTTASFRHRHLPGPAAHQCARIRHRRQQRYPEIYRQQELVAAAAKGNGYPIH